MNNPFQELADRLGRIETMLADLTNQPTNPASAETELLDVAGAAKLLRLTPQTIYDKVHNDTLPHVKRNARLYFFKDELIFWLKAARPTTAEVVPPVRRRRRSKLSSTGEESATR